MRAGSAVMCVAAALSGCATITTGTSQTVLVETSPDGAVCRFSRDSKEVGIVNPTPGTLFIDKSSKPLSVICTREGSFRGHRSAIGLQPWALIWPIVGSVFEPFVSGRQLIDGGTRNDHCLDVLRTRRDRTGRAVARQESSCRLKPTTWSLWCRSRSSGSPASFGGRSGSGVARHDRICPGTLLCDFVGTPRFSGTR